MFALIQTPRVKAAHFGFLNGLCTHFSQLAAAHARQARFAELPSGGARDAGLSPEGVLGEPAYDPALPFFFQAGFGQRQSLRDRA